MAGDVGHRHEPADDVTVQDLQVTAFRNIPACRAD